MKELQERERDGLYYTICMKCGNIPFKADEGSKVEVFCKKCGDKLYIEIKEGVLTIKRIEIEPCQKEAL